MSVTVEKLENEPIIVSTFIEPTGPHDQPELWKKLAETVEGMEAPIFRITDLSQITIKFGDMVIALAEETRGKKPGSAADPRIKSILVATGSLIEFAAKSITQKQYGMVGAPVLFTNLDDALAYARDEYVKYKSQ